MTVMQIFASFGIPEFVWKAIMQTESKGDPDAYFKTGREESVGLFQLNRMGGLGTGYSVGELKDPSFNATIAAKKMAPAYQRGVEQGLDGFALTQYVAYSSGWPTQAGTKALTYDKVVQAYNPKLQESYGVVTGGGGSFSPALGGGGGYGQGSGSTGFDGSSSTSAVGISSQLQTLQAKATAEGGGWANEAGAIGLMTLIAVLGLILLFIGLKLVSGGSTTAIIKEAAAE